jgi:hypothetical protein
MWAMSNALRGEHALIWQIIYWTAAVAVAVLALLLHLLEMRKNNRLNLFDKRIDVYTAASGMVMSYAALRNVIHNVSERDDDPLLKIDLYMRHLTNNSFLHNIASEFEAPRASRHFDNFSQKMTKVGLLPVKLRLLFHGEWIDILIRFVRSYIDALWTLKRYEICTTAAAAADVDVDDDPVRVDEIDEIKAKYTKDNLRQQLDEDMDILENCYIELMHEDVLSHIEHQIKP